MDPTLEIRQLSPSQVRDLVLILESHELWKRLMCIIPHKLENDFSCDITLVNHPKYNSEHFRLIENASEKSKKPCTEILLDEWGTSGKIRPRLGHLLFLLTKAKLFRAADYIAENLLHQVKPDRPETGPEALIPVNVHSTPILIGQESNEIEELLDKIDYPSTAVNIITSFQETRQKVHAVIPKIVITLNNENNQFNQEFTIPVVAQRDRTINNSVSHMIKFSSNSTNSMSIFNNSDVSSDIENPINNEFNCSDSSNINPAFSQLLKSREDVNSENIPNLSVLNKSSDTVSSTENTSEVNTEILPNFEVLTTGMISNCDNSSNLFPDFDILKSDITKSSTISFNLCSDPIGCTSPLPTLSLNTLLPHFNYSELQLATNNFNNGKYTTMRESGRLLGSGAFGYVFVATGIFDRLVAVKRLNLENVEEVNIDDIVTKQFCNEVELLSKYKHENLLSLLGYSCDGCTYCLMYEYIPGGALKDRLQENENKLFWKERIGIAVGTAKAVSYLHTAFDTPLIHRDIKSANILLDVTNKPKLCDFGLIKLTPSQNTSTATTVFGTSAYMAPEAFRGDISVKLDTFSFGVVLLELLTSLPPMDENRDGADLVTYVGETCDHDSISTLLDTSAGFWRDNENVDYAEQLFRIAEKCLEEKKKRPTMMEVAKLLDKLVMYILPLW